MRARCILVREKAKKRKAMSSKICIFNRVAGKVVIERWPSKTLERKVRQGWGQITGGLVDCQDLGFTLHIMGEIR